MTIDLTLILAMALVTYATRAMGFVAIHAIRATGALSHYLDLIAGLILGLILAWSLIHSPWQIVVGVGLGAIAMLFTGRFFTCMWLSVAATALFRYVW